MQLFTTAFWRRAWPGLAAATLLAIVADAVGPAVPWLGGAGVGILAGVVLASLFRLPDSCRYGCTSAGKQFLQLAVILLGAGLNLAVVWRTGVQTLGLMVATIGAVFLCAWLLGGRMGVPRNNRDLIASGTAICGGSAIAAVAPVIGAKDEEVSYSISVVFLFNLAAVVLFPLLGRAFSLDAETFGVWAGTAVNDTSSVLATSIAYDAASVPTATLVKMTRTVMIVPMALLFSFVAAARAKKGEGGGGSFSFARVFPWFVLGFLAMSVLATLGVLSPDLAGWLQRAGKFLIVVALSGIGLNTDIRRILATGARPILLGAVLWFVVAALALVMIQGMR